MAETAKVSVRSKVTANHKASIPFAIRELLALEEGDTLVFELVDGRVVLRRDMPMDADYLEAVSATFSEWESAEDDAAYGNL